MPGKKILVVDDIPENIKIISYMLKNKGFTIIIAQSGYEALEKLKSNVIDLVLLDVSMPGMDGYEVCERIKEDQKTADIPVIFVTARDNPDDIVKGFEKGAVDYLTRPVNSAELQARVAIHLELKSSRDIIEQQNRELRELNASKDKFLSILAHDLKNPIAGIITISQLVVKMYDSLEDSERRSYVEEIYSSTKRVLHILEDLLQWSRSQSGHLDYHPEQIQLYNITFEVTATIERSAAEKSISIINEVDEGAGAYADRHMISAVIRNLLSNAVKFTPQGGTVTLRAGEQGNRALYSIIDTGVGIARENMEKLFKIDGGLSTPGTNNEKGTGLGLILCKEFIEKNKGTITLESTPGQGSEFTLSLPKS
jgi:two-component system, sensor histidine kinase and response regulator